MNAEKQAVFAQVIQIGRQTERVAVAARRVSSLLIGKEKEDVWTSGYRHVVSFRWCP